MDHLPTPREDTGLKYWHRASPFSKYAAMALFVVVPFIGGWVGYTYAPEKIVEIEKVVIKDDFGANENIREKENGVGEYAFEILNDSVRIFVNSSGKTVQIIRLAEIDINKPVVSFAEVYGEIYGYGTPESRTRERESSPSLIRDLDINFDGYLDLGILVDTMPLEDGYVFYFYDQNTKRFVPAVLEDTPTESFVVYAPSVNQEEKVLTSRFTVTNPRRVDWHMYHFDTQTKTFTVTINYDYRFF
jgi:hypothetical protein